MKNRILCILIAALMCIALVGCGSSRAMDDGRRNDTGILPEVSPMISQDPEDGIVDDQDGIIGNGDEDSETGKTGNGSSTTVSPSPSAEAGTMPTTAPSASPNP